MQVFDVAVVGVGGMGSAALHSLAKAGLSVVGIEQFSSGHDRGSSHGETRIIRQAYFEHPDYVPLLQKAYRCWETVENESPTPLWLRTGLLEIGPPDGTLMQGIEASVRQHHLPVRRYDAEQCRDAFPQLVVPDGCVGIFEETAGILLVEECVREMVRQATAAGAILLQHEKVVHLQLGPEVRIQTESQAVTAKHLIIAAGPWSSELIEPLRSLLTVTRKWMGWHESKSPRMDIHQLCPAYFYELPHGCFYGFPAIDGRVKVAEHSGGEPLSGSPVDSGDSPSRSSAGRERVNEFVDRYLPDVGEWKEDSPCMYTMSPDEHFIVDRHPDFDNVAFVAGLSGHGFKFAPAIGQLLCRLVTEHNATTPEFLRLNRFP